jgi:hypothetical protein
MFATRDGERAGFTTEGRTFVVFGASSGFPASFSVAAEDVDLIINGGMSGFQLGDYIAAGDIDGDGADEIAIAAPFVDSFTGRVLVFDLNPPAAAGREWELYE